MGCVLKMSSLDFYVATEDTKEPQTVECDWVARPVCKVCHKMLPGLEHWTTNAIYCMGVNEKTKQICGYLNKATTKAILTR